MGIEKKIAAVLILVILYSTAIWYRYHIRSQNAGIAINQKKETTKKNATYKNKKNMVSYKKTQEPVKVLAMKTAKMGAQKKIAQPQPAKNNAEKEQKQEKSRYYRYKTCAGDSLWDIVRKNYETKEQSEIKKIVEVIVKTNKLEQNPDQLKPGKILLLPIIPEKTKTDDQRQTQHKVEKGQTLRFLAKKYYKNEKQWYYIYDANPAIRDPHILPCGTVLKIPADKIGDH